MLCAHDAGPHPVVEVHLAVLEWSSKWTLLGVHAEIAGDLRQRQIVRGDQADGAALDQAAQQRLGADRGGRASWCPSKSSSSRNSSGSGPRRRSTIWRTRVISA